MADPSFDAFLSYRSADRQTVEQIAVWLKEQGLAIWFDRWKLRPGLPWQEAIEVGLKYSKSIVVFVGEGGLGPWEEPEMRVALNEQVRRGCPVIPILLPKAGDSPDIPMFLRSQQWIDMRSGWPDTHGAVNLIWGITGREPLEIRASRHQPLTPRHHEFSSQTELWGVSPEFSKMSSSRHFADST